MTESKSLLLKTTGYLFKTANVFFFIGILILAWGAYDASPNGNYYKLYADESIEYKFYMQEGENLDIGLAVFSVNENSFNLERNYAEAILDMKLTYLDGETSEVVYSGASAAWSRNYVASQGYYSLVITNLTEDVVSFGVGHASVTGLTVIALAAGGAMVGIGAGLFHVVLAFLITAGVFYLLFLPIREIMKLDQQKQNSRIVYVERQAQH